MYNKHTKILSFTIWKIIKLDIRFKKPLKPSTKATKYHQSYACQANLNMTSYSVELTQEQLKIVPKVCHRRQFNVFVTILSNPLLLLILLYSLKLRISHYLIWQLTTPHKCILQSIINEKFYNILNFALY